MSGTPEQTPTGPVGVPLAQELALFPLTAVLLPGGLLPLRIFEPRYVDLIGRCLRQETPFGVVRIRNGSELDSGVGVEDIGTSASVIDFQPMRDGLLGVLCRGERRFRILARSQQADGLNRASVQWLAEQASSAPASQFAPLVQALRQAMASLTHSPRLIDPHYEDAGWVSYRLAELVPLGPAELQKLLELDDPHERLRLLAPRLAASGLP